MELSFKDINGINLIAVKGKLDSATTPQFETAFMNAIDAGKNKVLLDFKDLDYISSAGLRVLLLGAKLIKNSGGKIVISGMKEHVKQVFDIAGFTGMFSIHETTDDDLIA